MHHYEQVSRTGEGLDRSIENWRFNCAEDVVSLATVDRQLGWMTWPEVWHLDDTGKFCCYHRGTTLDSIRTWAADDSGLRRSRFEGLRSGGCTDHWIVVESRPVWLRPPPSVAASDVEAFVRLRAGLTTIGVALLDAVIFDDQLHWWSLKELVSGTTDWDAAGAEPQ